MSELKKENNQVTLCCGRKGSCPTIEKINSDIIIRDDYGSSVKMSKHQADLIQQALELLDG